MIGYFFSPKSGRALKSAPVYCFVADTDAAHTTPSTTTDTFGKYTFTDLDPTKSYRFECRAAGVQVQYRPAVPSARVYNSANISINNNTETALTFNSERWDTDSIHSTSSNTGRLTAATKGEYRIYGHVRFASHDTGNRYIYIKLNGTTALAIKGPLKSALGTVTVLDISTNYPLSVGDYVELIAFQDSGGALNVDAVGNFSPEFGMCLVSGG